MVILSYVGSSVPSWDICELDSNKSINKFGAGELAQSTECLLSKGGKLNLVPSAHTKS